MVTGSPRSQSPGCCLRSQCDPGRWQRQGGGGLLERCTLEAGGQWEQGEMPKHQGAGSFGKRVEQPRSESRDGEPPMVTPVPSEA